jgi:hypothetical protein
MSDLVAATEKQFEQDIETWLGTQGGYRKGDPKAFRTVKGGYFG